MSQNISPASDPASKSPTDAQAHGETDFIHSERFLARLMRRQVRLSIICAAAFLVVLLGLPLLNFYAPDLMAMRVGGFTLTWLILGVLMFPYVWIISGYFIKKSLKLEVEEAEWAKRENSQSGPK